MGSFEAFSGGLMLAAWCGMPVGLDRPGKPFVARGRGLVLHVFDQL